MNSFKFVIRDAIKADIDACLALDHQYESDYVWRMTMQTMQNGHQITFRKDGLPRAIHSQHHANGLRLHLALPRENCYLVAVNKDDATIIGYLTMRPEPIHQIAMIQDIVVDNDFRGLGIGSRLLGIARQWASEHGAKKLMVELPTTNYPAIHFLQNHGLRFCGFNDQYFRNQDISVFFGQTIH